jgi:hypothetical protein
MVLLRYVILLQAILLQGAAVDVDHKGHLKSIQILPKGMLEHNSGIAASKMAVQSNHIMEADGSMESLLEADTASDADRMKLVRSEHYLIEMPHLNSTSWSYITQQWIRTAASRNKVLTLSTPVVDWATAHSGSWNPISLLATGVKGFLHQGCGWQEEDQEKYVEKILTGSFAAAGMAMLLVAIASAVMCCGAGVDSVIHHTGKFGLFLIFFATLSALLPAIASHGHVKALTTISAMSVTKQVRIHQVQWSPSHAPWKQDRPSRMLVKRLVSSLSISPRMDGLPLLWVL